MTTQEIFRPLTPPWAFCWSIREAKPLGILAEFDESEPVSEVINATFTVFAVTPGALALLPAAPLPPPVDPVGPVDPVEAAVVAVELDGLELLQPDAIRATMAAATTKAPHPRRTLPASIAILPLLEPIMHPESTAL
jgi:hypothetical protein